MTLVERLRSWAQNEEMVNQHFTEHGRDCNEAAERLELVDVELSSVVVLPVETVERVTDALNELIQEGHGYDPEQERAILERARAALRELATMTSAGMR